MASDRMSRNDSILLLVFVSTLLAIVLITFAPTTDDTAFRMRLWAVADSPISIAVVSTAIAAFAGTWGAQALAERTAKRNALLSEIRSTNIALGLIFNIANTYITTKKQLVRDMVRDYEEQVAARQAHIAGPNAIYPFQYRVELMTITPPLSPIDELRRLMSERITPDGKAIILLTPLLQSINAFADTVSQRNAWIAEVRAMPDGNDTTKAAWFFGLPYAPGRTDDRYPRFISALKTQTDDCIAFSILIGQSLVDYGDRLAARYGDGAPKISKANYKKAADLLPDMSAYADWLKN